MDAKTQLEKDVEDVMPEWASRCNEIVRKGTAKVVMVHHRSFGDEPAETAKMGMALKYACLRGLAVLVVPHHDGKMGPLLSPSGGKAVF